MLPVIDVYTVAYNEEEMLPHFLSHYSFARRLVIYDNESVDLTTEIAKSRPNVVLRSFATGGKYSESAQMAIRNSVGRNLTRTTVVVCDVDEFIDCQPLEAYGRHEVAFRVSGPRHGGL